MFSSVDEFLISQIRSRPQTFKEILAHVDKSRANVWRELNGLLLFGDVSIIVLRFNGLKCSFYTLRKDVEVTLVKGPLLLESRDAIVVSID